ncbi:MAG: MATE family efflux transporter [Eubacterium sp.]
MKIQISDHFTTKKLIRFALPSIVMMMFTSIYGVVDGFFVSNYAGKTPFAAVNLIMPFIMLLSCIGFMVGTGGSALVSKTFGEGDKKKANEIFSMLIYFVIILGIILTVAGQLMLRKISSLLGADDSMLDYCVLYGRITLASLTFFMLQNAFQSFFVTAEKPNLGLMVTIMAGVTNMALDFIFVGVMKWGISGAAIATMISEIIGGGVPLIYFFSKNKSLLKLSKTHFDGKALLKTCTNGSSELMTNLSVSLVNMLYNYQLIKFFGQNGVAAYGVIMYVSFIFAAVFFGYSIGVAPIIGYNYGAQNHYELKNMFKKSLWFNGISGLAMTMLAVLLSDSLSEMYVGYDKELFELTKMAFILFSTRYLISGFNVFSSSFFTALNNGLISALISFLRTFIFQIAAIFILPVLFTENSIWLSITVSELLTLAVSVFFFITQHKKYHYM